jgi:hypothetical protein
MVSRRSFSFALIGHCLLFSASIFAQKAMTNRDVVRLIEQHLSTAQIVERINAAPSGFQLYSEDIAKLRDAGVSETILKAMSARQTGDKYKLEGSETAPLAAPPAPPIVGSPEVASNSYTAPATAPAHQQDSEFALRPGHPEIWGHVGAGVFENRLNGTTYEWYAGAGMAAGITRNVAIVGEYNYNGFTGSSALGFFQGRGTMQDLIAGIRVSSTGPRSVYVIAGGGTSHYNAAAAALGIGGILAGTDPAFAIGGGINVAVSKKAGIQCDFRAIKPTNFIWYSRASFGTYFRF